MEKKLQEGQQKLSASEELLNKRESRLNVWHGILTQRKMNLEVSRRKITEAAYLELKEKEAAIIARLADFEARETVRGACLCSSSSLLFFEKILNGCATERASEIAGYGESKKRGVGASEESVFKGKGGFEAGKSKI